jgi:hypothetical protein
MTSNPGDKRATGPRSAGGKRRSSRNAVRHGLSTPASANKSLHARAEHLTDILAGPDATLTRREHAAAIADAQIDLFRVRATKISILEGIAGETHASFERVMKLFRYVARFGLDRAIERLAQDHVPEEPLPPEGMVRELEVFRRALPELLKLERYEKRALSRRKFAIRALYGYRA